MTSEQQPSQAQHNPALAFTWGKYREFSATARKRKDEISNWRFRVLMLGVGGAISGVFSQTLLDIFPDDPSMGMPSKVLGIISALALALATYFGKELVNPDKEKEQIRARSIAESLKSECYQFVAGASPYNGKDRDEQLLEKTESLLEQTADLRSENLSEADRLKRILADKMDVDTYIKERVDDQITYYFSKSDEYVKKMDGIRNFSLFLGIVAVVAGALSVVIPFNTAAWVAVISTITSSIAAYAYANRYQYLLVSYQSAGKRLEALKYRWEILTSKKPTAENINEFIQKCERTLSLENSAWMSELSSQMPIDDYSD